MCGRMNITDSVFVQSLLAELGIDIGPLPTRYNIAPTEDVLTVHCDSNGQYVAGWYRWWLVPSWSSGPSNKFAMFNARAETIATSKAYKAPFKNQRCIVLASSFIEWLREEGTKQPYQIQGDDGALLLAGVWDEFNGDLRSCSILTQAASPEFNQIHHRMPLSLTLQQAKLWLARTEDADGLLNSLRGQTVALNAFPVDKGVNNSRNKQATSAQGSSVLLH